MSLPQPISANYSPTKKRRLQRVTLQSHQVAAALQVHNAIAITPEQRHYLVNVLRLEAGSEFIALDCQGGWWLAQLSSDLNMAEVIAQLENNAELDTHISLAIAMPKGSNIESVIRQTTELGLREIVPLFCDRTVLKAGMEMGKQKRDRWQRIAAEAAELSMRTYVPKIQTPQSFAAWLETLAPSPAPSLKYICVTSPAPHLLTCLQNQIPDAQMTNQIAIATGCEGGWTTREEEIAIAAGFIPISLGDRVLSAVTAPVVALSIIGAFLDTH